MHVTRSDGLTGASPARLAEQRRLVETLGGTYHQVVGDDVADALLEFARAENATQLVLGASRRSRLAALLTGPGIGATTIRDSGDIDVHLVTHHRAGRGRGLPRPRGQPDPQRRLLGSALAVLLPAVLTLVLTREATDLNLASDTLLYLLVVVVVALVGGFLPAMLAAISGSLLLNYYFAPPLHTLTIRDTNNALAIGVFILVAALVSSVVDLAARRTRQAARATAEAEMLGTLAGSVLRGETALPALLERVREGFGLHLGHPAGVRLVHHRSRVHRARPGRRVAGRRRGRLGSVPSTGGRRHRGPGRRHADARPAGPPAAGGGPAGGGRVRGAGRRHPRAAPAQRGRRRGRPHRRGRPDADRAARRGRPRPAHPAGRGQGSRDQPAQRRDRRGPRQDHAELLSRPTSPSTGSPAWSTTCST